MPITGRDICQDALLELNVLQAGDMMGPDDAVFCIGKLARIFDNWNADRDAVYAEVFTDYIFTPHLSPHTIGPTGTFVVAQRPVSLQGAALILSTTNHPTVDIPVKDAAWYFAISVPDLEGPIPEGVYYDPTWPNGSLYFYTVPSTAYGVTLWTRQLLTALALTDTFTLPPGYRDAATLTLAEEIATPFQKAVPQDLSRRAREARSRIFDNNRTIPRLDTADSGMPGGGGGSGGTYLNGWSR